MTDKEQIIIDGVDVNGCENYKPKNRFTCNPYICNCHEKPDCYFKQLVRKTQECDELISEKDFYLQKIEVLDQECKELKAYAQRQENQREEYYKEYLKKDKALEELKKLADANPNSTLRLRNEIRDLQAVSVKRKEALEEIEEVLKDEICEECPGEGGCKGGPCIERKCLDIINKVKGEE